MLIQKTKNVAEYFSHSALPHLGGACWMRRAKVPESKKILPGGNGMYESYSLS